MQLLMSTDYAIRALLYLANSNGRGTAPEIAKEMRISLNYLRKILFALRDAGWVDTQYGSYGGCQLVKEPENITLYDVITLTEGTIKINRCLEDDRFCSRDAAGHCPVHRYYAKVQAALETSLRAVTLADMLRQTDLSEPARSMTAPEGENQPILLGKERKLWEC